jgi:hypothetical protein
MEIPSTKLVLRFFLLVLAFPLLAGCGGGNNSASGEESVCTIYSSEISGAEEMESGFVNMNRILGGSETQISPTPLQIGGWAFALAGTFASQGITYDSGVFNQGAVEKFLDVAGQCLSDDTYQYFSNYID